MQLTVTRYVAAFAVLTSATALAQTTWTTASSSGAPAPDGGSAWDSARGRLVAFGGQLGATQQNSTREWNGTSWQTVVTSNTPSPRTRPAMAFDEARGVTVLFGGGSSFGNDTWTYNGTTWTQANPSSVPPARFGSALAYDKLRQVVVMFGGFVPSGQDANDVWEWDGTNWSQRLPGGSQPARRGAHRMVFDESINQVVLVGGFRTPINRTVADTWSWNGTSWTQYTDLPGASNARCDQAMDYDQARQRIVLYGGTFILSGSQTQLSDTWEWSGGTWTQRTPTQNVLGTRANATAAYVPSLSALLVAGGNAVPGFPANNTAYYRSVTMGSANSFGVPCAVTNGVELEIATQPYLGLPFTQRIVNASPSAIIGLLVFGASLQTTGGIPLGSIGAPGCTAYATGEVLSTIILTNGAGELTWNIPNLPTAAGYSFGTQGVVLDPTSPLPLQLDMTAGRQCSIGNP